MEASVSPESMRALAILPMEALQPYVVMATQIKLGIVDSRTLKPKAGGGSKVQGQSALLCSKTVSKLKIQTRTPAKKLVKRHTRVVPSIF